MAPGKSTIACTGGRSVWVAVVLLIANPLNVVFWYICRSDCFFTALGLLLTMFVMFGIEGELRPFARGQCDLAWGIRLLTFRLAMIMPAQKTRKEVPDSPSRQNL